MILRMARKSNRTDWSDEPDRNNSQVTCLKNKTVFHIGSFFINFALVCG
jgi:hypothetical protein